MACPALSIFAKWSSVIKGTNTVKSPVLLSTDRLNWLLSYNIGSLKPCVIEQLKYQYGAIGVPAGRYSLYKDDEIEVALWKWKPSGWVPLHSHGGGPCVWRVLQGRLSEARWSTSGNNFLAVYEENDIALVDSFARHQMMNQGINDAMSLHLYRVAPPSDANSPTVLRT